MNEKEDVLSQDEIDDLLGMMGDDDETEKMPGNRVLSQPQIDKIFNVKPCDLGRADVFTNPQKQAVFLMFEKLARRMTTWFSANLYVTFMFQALMNLLMKNLSAQFQLRL